MGIIKASRRDPRPLLLRLVNRWETIAIAIAISVARLFIILWEHRPVLIGLDFSQYYTWAVALRWQVNPYRTDLRPIARHLGVVIEPIRRTLYPPTFLLLTEPLALFRPRAAYWIWIGLTVAVLMVALILLLATELPSPLAAITAALAICYRPMEIHFMFGQFQIPLLLLLVLVMRELRWNRDGAAALFLALAGLLKAYPLFMIVHFVCDRRWRALAWTAAAVVAGFMLTALIIGREAFDFFSAVQRAIVPGRGAPMLPIVSVPGAMVRSLEYFVSPEMVRAHFLTLIKIVSRLISLALLAMAVRAALRSRARGGDMAHAFGLFITTMVLITPIAWPHYMVLLLIPLAQIFIAAYRGEAPRSAVWLAIAAYLLPEISYQAAVLELGRGRPFLANVLMEGMFWSVVLTYAASHALVSHRASAGAEVEAVGPSRQAAARGIFAAQRKFAGSRI